MQDFLTLAATATLFSTIAFILIGYPLYVWHRTAPVTAPVAAVPTPAAPVEPPAPVLPVGSTFTAAAPATPVSVPQLSLVPQEVVQPVKRKRGRPPKAA